MLMKIEKVLERLDNLDKVGSNKPKDLFKQISTGRYEGRRIDRCEKQFTANLT